MRPDAFAVYLRKLEVAPNGHEHSAKRKLRDKGIQYILETCRSMYNFALKRRHLPPYVSNPFSELPLDHFEIGDAKSIFVFTADTELAFFEAASDWTFAIHLRGFALRAPVADSLVFAEIIRGPEVNLGVTFGPRTSYNHNQPFRSEASHGK